MKVLKRALIVVVIALPIILYSSIYVANNCIADKIEKNLIAHNLPSDTAMVDSLSAAGKLSGSGNGMQYMGAILIKSDLSQEELQEYYSSDFDFVEVRKQETAKIDFVNASHYRFSKFPETNGDTFYSVTCWDSDREEEFGDFIITLLDLDIRGH